MELESKYIKFNNEPVRVSPEWEIIPPMRAFDYKYNDGCWVLARTPFMEQFNTFMVFVRLDTSGRYILEDPQYIADWTV
jgi:hypothetical protein